MTDLIEERDFHMIAFENDSAVATIACMIRCLRPGNFGNSGGEK